MSSRRRVMSHPSRCRALRRRSLRRIAGIERLEVRELFAGDVGNDLASLNDEFDNPATLAQWQRIHEVEGWNADQLDTFDIGQTHPGRLTMAPHTSVWYEDYRGPLAFKEVSGDFEVVTQVSITDRDDVGDSDPDSIPNGSLFSLGGIMIRTPRGITNPASEWTPGTRADDGTNNGENFVFLSLGHGTNGAMTLEVKSTRNSLSQINLLPVDTQTAELRLTRLGNTVTATYRLPGAENWTLAQSFQRPDMPETLQVGMVSYTNYDKAADFDPFYHNGHVLSDTTTPPGEDPTPFEAFNPDVEASFEYVRFARPAAAQPGDPAMGVGVNLEGLFDWTPGMPFKDAFLKSRPWTAFALNPQIGYWTFQTQAGGGPELQIDDRGWVTELATWTNEFGETVRQGAQSVIFTPEARNPAGTYTLEWDGTGEILLGNTPIEPQGVTSDGSHFAEVDLPGSIFLGLLISETDPSDPIRNIDFWMPNPDGPSFAGQNWDPSDPASPSPFLPSFLEPLAGVSTIRFMDWMHTNFTEVQTWDDRRAFDYATQADGVPDSVGSIRGVAPEYMIALANELQVDMWVNMPAQADDTYVQNFATLVRDTLDPDLNVYVEYSNELWNGFFPVHHWLFDQADATGTDFFGTAAREMRNDFSIWSDVFAGQQERITRVVGAQAANPWIAQQLVARMDGEFDAISPTAYAGIGPGQVATFTAETTAEEIIQRLYDESIPWALGVMAEHAELADQYSVLLDREIELVSYESGAHIFSFFSGLHQSPAVAAAVEASNHPEMYNAYMTLLEGMRDVGVDLYNEFTYTGNREPSLYGAYGLIASQFDTEPTYQYQAIFDFIGSQQPDPDPEPEPDPEPLELTSDGTLVVRGDALDNELVIRDQGNGRVDVRLTTPATGDEIAETFSGVVRIAADLAEGDDRLVYRALHVAAPVEELVLQPGAGQDRASLDVVLGGREAAFSWDVHAEQVDWTARRLVVPAGAQVAIAVSGVESLTRTLQMTAIEGEFRESITGTPANDTLRLTTSHILVASGGVLASDIATGAGNDRVVDNLYWARNNGRFEKDVQLGAGDDQFDGWQQQFTHAGSGESRVDGGAGDDRIFRYLTHWTLEASSDFALATHGGAGRDNLRTVAWHARIDGALDLLAAGGDDDDLIQLLASARAGSRGSLAARVHGEGGDDRMCLGVSAPNSLDEFFTELDGGEGDNVGYVKPWR